MISFVSASKISFDFLSSYTDSYSDICYLGADELSIFVSFLWMIWVDLPFLMFMIWVDLPFWSIYISIYLSISTKFNNVLETVKKIQPLAFILWKKRPLLQQSVQLKHRTKKDFLWRSCYLKWLDSFLQTSRTQGVLNKTLSSRYLPNFKTSWRFCHISKQKDLFCRPRTHGSNWRENCLLEREKKQENMRKW